MPDAHPTLPERETAPPYRGTIRRRWVAWLVSICIVVALLPASVHFLLSPLPIGHVRAGAPPASTATPGAPAPRTGHYAPDVLVFDLAQRPLRLSQLRGKVVVLNFWYVACEPCQYEMPALERTYQAYASKGVIVLGVDAVDDAPTMSSFQRQIGITYPLARDEGQQALRTYQVLGTPTSFVIDRQAVIRDVILGPAESARLRQDLDRALAPVHA